LSAKNVGVERALERTVPARVNLRQVCLVGLVVAVVGAISAGCADTIFVDYQPQWWGPRIADGNRLTVKVVVHDARNDPTRVGMKKNAYTWWGLGPIVTTNDVAVFVEDNLQNEFRRRGFRSSGPGSVLVVVTLNHFFNEFRTGVLSNDAEAEVRVYVRVYKGPVERGTPIYHGHFEGSAVEENVRTEGGETAKLALDAAFADLVRKVLSNDRLLTAILEMAPPEPPAAAPSNTPPSS